MRHLLAYVVLTAGVCGSISPAFAQNRLGAAQQKPAAAASAAAEPKFGLIGFRHHAMSAANCGQPACATPAPVCATPAPVCMTPAPSCCPPAPCCPTPTIVYRHLHKHRKVCCGCCEPAPISIVLSAKMPCTGCPVEIPLCIPGCTTGEPKVCCDTGIFGRGVQWYEWPNGFAAKLAFTHSGNVIVTTFGS